MKKIIIIALLLGSLTASAQTTIKPEAIQTHTSGSTVSASSGVGILRVNPGSTLAALTITFPATPNDRDVLLILYGGTLTSGTVVTLLTLSGTILGTLPTTALAGTAMMYFYDASTAKWYRLY